MMAQPPKHEQYRRMAKADMRKRVVDSGKWKEFVTAREKHKEAGKMPDDAWKAAYDEVMEDPLGSDDPPRERIVKTVKSESRPTRRSVTELDVSGSVFEEKTCSTPRTVEWVAANIRVSDPKPEDAPSSEAWSMLCWVKSSPQAEAQFWGQIYTKLLPTRQQLDADNRMEDDGRRVLSIIDRIKKASEKEEESE